MIEVHLHGGNCCGVKHFMNFGSDPETMTPGRAAIIGSSNTSFCLAGGNYSPGLNDCGVPTSGGRKLKTFFNAEAPAEKMVDRFHRMLEFVQTHRRSGMIEILLVDGQSKWFPILEAKGFVKVGRVKNSNSYNHINMFLLCYGTAVSMASEPVAIVENTTDTPPAPEVDDDDDGEYCDDPECSCRDEY